MTRDMTSDVTSAHCAISVSRPASDTLCVRLAGSWTVDADLPSVNEVQRTLGSSPPAQRLTFDSTAITSWDSLLLTFLLAIRELCVKQQVTFEVSGLPKGVQGLLHLATAVPERAGARQVPGKPPLFPYGRAPWRRAQGRRRAAGPVPGLRQGQSFLFSRPVFRKFRYTVHRP